MKFDRGYCDRYDGARKREIRQAHRRGMVPIRRWGKPDDIGKAVAAIARGDFRSQLVK